MLIKSLQNGGVRTQKVYIDRYTYKPVRLPDPFVLVIDSREQRPLFLEDRIEVGSTKIIDCAVCERLHVVCEKCPDGVDYTVKGYEQYVGIERKQISDFFTYIGRDRKRTDYKRAMMAELLFAGLVVEADIEELEIPYTYSKRITAEHVRGFITSCNVKYGIHTYFNRNRTDCERWVLDRLVCAVVMVNESMGIKTKFVRKKRTGITGKRAGAKTKRMGNKPKKK